MGDNPPPGVNLKHTVFHYEKSMNTYQPNKLIQANKKPNKSKRTSGIYIYILIAYKKRIFYENIF